MSVKTWSANVTVKFSDTGIEAVDEQEFRELLKAQYRQDFEIELADSEITDIESSDE